MTNSNPFITFPEGQQQQQHHHNQQQQQHLQKQQHLQLFSHFPGVTNHRDFLNLPLSHTNSGKEINNQEMVFQNPKSANQQFTRPTSVYRPGQPFQSPNQFTSEAKADKTILLTWEPG
jgi:hypothetical protein